MSSGRGLLPPVHEISLSVFFPCYNEAENVEKVVRNAAEVLASLVADWEIIIVNDGSADQTGAIADRLAADNPRIRAVHHPTNKGYGAALATGFTEATKELVFYTDGDGQFDFSEINRLLDCIEEADIVSGYRRKRQDSLIRRINGAGWSWLSQRLLGFRCRDVNSAFKLYKREIFDRIEIKSTSALVNAEILARAVRTGYTIKTVPVVHFPRKAGEQTGAKLSVIFRAFCELLKLRRDIVRS